MIKISEPNLYFNEDERLIVLSDKITNETCGQINSFLLKLIYEDFDNEAVSKKFVRQPIHFYIDSIGGSSYDSWSTVSIIANSNTPIYTYCMGYAMSAGFKLFLAGHKRFMSKNAVLMYHQTSTTARGKLQDIIEDIDETNKVFEQYEKYVLERTDIPEQKLREIAEKKANWYIRSDEAKKYNIAEIVN